MTKNIDKIPPVTKINFLRRKLIEWYENHKRLYPWRKTRDPFKVLVAEMMLRRTKADQVKPVYDNLIEEYPDVNRLSKAKDEKIEKILFPLGLRWRTTSFTLMAREVREKYKSKIPKTREKLKELTGVGEYVAGAVLSFAYGRKEWIVDSNIVRLFKRYFGIKTSKEGRRDKHIIDIAKLYVSCQNPREANLAILDFTAILCTPKNPRCEKCPLNIYCFYISKK